MMSKYTTWCDEEDNTKEDAITSNKRTIGPRAGRDRHGVLSARRDEMSGPPNMHSLTKERFLRGCER